MGGAYGRPVLAGGIVIRLSAPVASSPVADRSAPRFRPGATEAEIRREYGIGTDRVARFADLSKNESPYGPSPEVVAALHAHVSEVGRYGPDGAPELRERIGRRHRMGAENVVVTAGGSEAIELSMAALVAPGERVVVPRPMFGHFRNVAAHHGILLEQVPLRADGTHDLARMADVAESTGARAVVGTAPHNPSGTQHPRAEWVALAERLRKNGTLLFMDGAYEPYSHAPEGFDEGRIARFATEPKLLAKYRRLRRRSRKAAPNLGKLVRRYDNVLSFYTMSKRDGMPSVRGGYVLGASGHIAKLHDRRSMFNVNGFAVAGMKAALASRVHRAQTVARNKLERDKLANALRELGFPPRTSQTNFVSFAAPERAYVDLLRKGFIVRSGESLDDPGFIRISLGDAATNDRLIAALRELAPTWPAHGRSSSASDATRASP